MVEHLLAPIFRQKAIDRACTPDPLFALQVVRHRWREQPIPVLEAAVEAVITERRAKVKPSDIDDAVRKARKHHDAAKIAGMRQARQAAATGEPVTYRAGSPEFEAYVAANPAHADRLRGRGFVKLGPAAAAAVRGEGAAA